MLDENDWWKEILGLMERGPQMPNMAGGPRVSSPVRPVPNNWAATVRPSAPMPPARRPMTEEILPPISQHRMNKVNPPVSLPLFTRIYPQQSDHPTLGNPPPPGPDAIMPNGFLPPGRKSTFQRMPNSFVRFLQDPQIMRRIFGDF